MNIKISPRSFDESHVVISTAELSALIQAAGKNFAVEVEDFSPLKTTDLMTLAETGGAFDFLNDEREDIYSVEDLQVRYK